MPKVLTMRVNATDEKTTIEVEFLEGQIKRDIPIGRGLSRMAAIIGDDGKLVDVEVVTERVQ